MNASARVMLEWLGNAAFAVTAPGGSFVLGAEPGATGAPAEGCTVTVFDVDPRPSRGDGPAREGSVARVVECAGVRIVHVPDGVAGPAFEAMRDRGPIDVALLPGWDRESSETRLEWLAQVRVMCDVLRPRFVFVHGPFAEEDRFDLDVRADFARSGQGATVLYGPPGTRFPVLALEGAGEPR